MTRRRVVVTGMGVVAPNGIGLSDFDAALRAGRSGIRHVPKLAELGFACTVAGVPQGTDAIAESYFDSDLLLAMNSNHRYGSIAAVDAWTDAGFARPEPRRRPRVLGGRGRPRHGHRRPRHGRRRSSCR